MHRQFLLAPAAGHRLEDRLKNLASVVGFAGCDEEADVKIYSAPAEKCLDEGEELLRVDCFLGS